MYRNILVFLLIIYAYIPANCQENKTNKLYIYFRQRILPGPNPDVVYQLSDNKLNIYHVDIWKKFKIGNKKPIYSKRLKSAEIDSIVYHLNISSIQELNNTYSGQWIDGINWTVTIKLDKFEKEIFLNNYYLPEIDEVLLELNSRLPDEYRQISFDYFNIKKEFLNQ
jgi:hypothetical protein